MPEKKTEEANTQTDQPRRITRIIFIAMIVLLLLLSISGLFFIVKSRNKDFQLVTNTEMPTSTPSPTSIYLETPPAQSEFYDTFKKNTLPLTVSTPPGNSQTVN